MRYLLIISTLCLLLTSCQSESPSVKPLDQTSFIKISSPNDPESLDPRKVTDLISVTALRMIYEGLTKTSENGLEMGIAESVTVSPDNKVYTFKLRDAKWSNGDPVTAEDFVQTWISVLSPEFPCPNAYQLYVIKGAKEAKEGKIPPDSIGVEALSPDTLVVELESPTPYFLELASTYFFFPVHSSIRDNAYHSEDDVIGNGALKLDHWEQRSEVVFSKNPLYWNSKEVSLAGIHLYIMDENVALKLFQANQLDWAGSPLSTIPREAVSTFKGDQSLQIKTGIGVSWIRLNTNTPPFTNEKIRRAFALAINRKEIVDYVTKANQLPATSIVPPSLSPSGGNIFKDNNQEEAQKLFEQGKRELADQGIDFPKISLNYVNLDFIHKVVQAVQQQWKEVLGVEVSLESNEVKTHVDKLSHGQYQMGFGSWYADFPDSISFLEIFRSKDNRTNQTGWSSPEYTALIDRSFLTTSAEERKLILGDSERMLVSAMPVIPLYHVTYNYLQSNAVKGVYFSELGYLDFTKATVER